MWLALDHGPAKGEGMESVLPRLEAVLRFTEELRGRFVATGVDGIAGALGLYRSLRSVLDAIPEAEVTRMLAEVEALTTMLGDLERSLEEVRRLKMLVGTR